MSGFKDDVISILRDNVMLHGEAVGLVWTGNKSDDLLAYLVGKKFPATNSFKNPPLTFDYVVIPSYMKSAYSLLKAMSLLNKNGIIIMDVSDWNKRIVTEYKSRFGNFTATSLNYGDRAYLVIHEGADYGN